MQTYLDEVARCRATLDRRDAHPLEAGPREEDVEALEEGDVEEDAAVVARAHDCER